MKILISLASIYQTSPKLESSTPENPYKKWLKIAKGLNGFDRTLTEKNGLVKALDKDGRTISVYAPPQTPSKTYPVVLTDNNITEVDPNEPILVSRSPFNELYEPPANASIQVW